MNVVLCYERGKYILGNQPSKFVGVPMSSISLFDFSGFRFPAANAVTR